MAEILTATSPELAEAIAEHHELCDELCDLLREFPDALGPFTGFSSSSLEPMTEEEEEALYLEIEDALNEPPDLESTRAAIADVKQLLMEARDYIANHRS